MSQFVQKRIQGLWAEVCQTVVLLEGVFLEPDRFAIWVQVCFGEVVDPGFMVEDFL